MAGGEGGRWGGWPGQGGTRGRGRAVRGVGGGGGAVPPHPLTTKGKEWTKLVVPSSGSTSHVGASVSSGMWPRAAASSSPMKAWPGKASRMRPRMIASHRLSVSVTRSTSFFFSSIFLGARKAPWITAPASVAASRATRRTASRSAGPQGAGRVSRGPTPGARDPRGRGMRLAGCLPTDPAIGAARGLVNDAQGRGVRRRGGERRKRGADGREECGRCRSSRAIISPSFPAIMRELRTPVA